MSRIETFSVFNEDDFNASYYSKYNQTLASSVNAGADQYFYDESTNTVAVNLGSASSIGVIRKDFSRLARGDNFIVSGRLSGDIENAVIDIDEIDESGGLIRSSGRRKVPVPPSGWADFKVKTVYRQTTGSKFARVSFGTIKSTTGEGLLKVRDLKIEIQSNIGDGASNSTETRNSVGAAWWHNGVWENRSDWPDSGFSITTDANTTIVTFNESFNMKPIVHVSGISELNGSGKKPDVYQVSPTSFQIAFRDVAGTIIPTANYSNDMFFQFSAIGI